MPRYIFTLKRYEELKKLINETKERLAQATKTKAESGSGQDTWHDEGFKMGTVEEIMWSKRLGELQELAFNAQTIEPEEQNISVKIGTGIIVEYEDGTIGKYILEGYMVNVLGGRISFYSPLGKALLGAREGEERILEIGNVKKIITIQRIFSPSAAETIFQMK